MEQYIWGLGVIIKEKKTRKISTKGITVDVCC